MTNENSKTIDVSGTPTEQDVVDMLNCTFPVSKHELVATGLCIRLLTMICLKDEHEEYVQELGKHLDVMKGLCQRMSYKAEPGGIGGL